MSYRTIVITEADLRVIEMKSVIAYLTAITKKAQRR